MLFFLRADRPSTNQVHESDKRIVFAFKHPDPGVTPSYRSTRNATSKPIEVVRHSQWTRIRHLPRIPRFSPVVHAVNVPHEVLSTGWTHDLLIQDTPASSLVYKFCGSVCKLTIYSIPRVGGWQGSRICESHHEPHNLTDWMCTLLDSFRCKTIDMTKDIK